MLLRQTAAIFILRRALRRAIGQLRHFNVNRAIRRVHVFDDARQGVAGYGLLADAQRGGLCKEDGCHRLHVVGAAENAQQCGGAVLLHLDGREVDVQRAGREQFAHHVLVNLRVEIVDVRLQDRERGDW